MLSQQDMEDFMDVEAALDESGEAKAKRRKVPEAAEVGNASVDGQPSE
jgi:hypothetical protein